MTVLGVCMTFNYTKQRVETAQAYLTKAQSIIDQGGYKAVKATK